MPGASFEQSYNAGIRVDVGGSDDGYVDGLNSLKVYGITNQVNDVSQFRVGFTSKYVSVGDLGGISFGGNDLSSDGGQQFLKTAALNKTKLTTTRFYKNLTDFFMPDLATDANSSIQISKYDIAEADVNGLYAFTGEAVFNGAPATFYIHHTSTTIVVAADIAGDTLTDATSGQFVTDGVKVGDTILLGSLITETTDQYTQHLVTAVTETVITTDSLNALTAQSTGSSFTIHAGRF